MKLKYLFEIVDMGDEYIAVPVGEKADELCGVVKLNKTGSDVFELLKSETNEKKIIDSLSEKYDDDRATMEGHVHSFIQMLSTYHLIEE